MLANLQWPQNGAGGVHEEESQVTQNIGEGEEALSNQDGMEGVPVLPLCVWIIFELQIKEKLS